MPVAVVVEPSEVVHKRLEVTGVVVLAEQRNPPMDLQEQPIEEEVAAAVYQTQILV